MTRSEPYMKIKSDLFDNVEMIQALRKWHQNAATTRPVSVGVNGDRWLIPYGTKFKPTNGYIEMARNNFEVVGATAGGPNSPVKYWKKYNHALPGHITVGMVNRALDCTDLYADGNAVHRCIVILLFSECARSTFVQQFVKALLEGTSFTPHEWSLIVNLIQDYGKAQLLQQRTVDAGPAWKELTPDEQMSYYAGSTRLGHRDYAELLQKTYSPLSSR